MANQEQLEILRSGVNVWNDWRKLNPNVKVDLGGADLSGADLRRANLSEADLRRANLSEAFLGGAWLKSTSLAGARLWLARLEEAYLGGADLSGADLIGAEFWRAHLGSAILCGANGRQASFTMAYLGSAQLIRANLFEANFNEASLVNAQLQGANLSGASLVNTDLTKANLSGCHIFGISAWNVKLEGATQSELVITRDDEPMIKVDDLEVAQFVYLLLNRKKLRNVLNAVMEKGVLILGRFGDGGLELLQAIAEKLRELEYLPMIFDFERPESGDYTQTIMTLAGLSRFVIADLSGPSVPQELYAIVPHFDIPIVPIIEEGREEYAMFVDLRVRYSWVLDPVPFENKEQLIKSLPEKVIKPAEERHQEKQKILDKIFKPVTAPDLEATEGRENSPADVSDAE